MHLGSSGLTVTALLLVLRGSVGAPAGGDDSTEIIRSLTQNYYVINCNYVDGILRNCFTPTETVVQQQQRQQPQQQRLFTAPPPPPPPRAPLVNYRIEPRIAAVPRQQVVVRQGPPKSVPRNTLARIINQVDYVQPTTVRSTQPVTRQQEDDEDVKAVPLDDVDAVKALVKKYRTRPNSV